jgi:hypothetical protein
MEAMQTSIAKRRLPIAPATQAPSSEDWRSRLHADRPVYGCPKCGQTAMQFFARLSGPPEREDVFYCCSCGSTWDM